MNRLSRVLISLLILSLLFSFGYAAAEGVHDCNGDSDCPICKVIAILNAFLGVFSLPILIIVGLCLREDKIDDVRRGVETRSPIALKVKMSN